MSQPASTATLSPSTDVECACAVNPARCASCTITVCTAGENVRYALGPLGTLCSLEAYFMKSIPYPVYARTIGATCSGDIQVNSGPTVSENVELMRSAKAGLASSRYFGKKFSENGPSSPMMFPAQRIRLPGISPELIFSRTDIKARRGPQ